MSIRRCREHLTKYKFPGDDTPIVRGSALKALEGDKGELGGGCRRWTSFWRRVTRSSRSRAGAGQAVPDARGGRVAPAADGRDEWSGAS